MGLKESNFICDWIRQFSSMLRLLSVPRRYRDETPSQLLFDFLFPCVVHIEVVLMVKHP